MDSLTPETDLVFRPDPVEGHVEDDAPDTVRLGRSWAPGDGQRVLDGIRAAVLDHRPLRIRHSGAGGVALARTAQAEHPGLAVEEDAPAAVRATVGWRHWRLHAPAGTAELECVMITGGLGGIGLYLAAHLARLGVRVWLVDRAAPADLQPSAAALLQDLVASGRVTVTTADLAGPDAGCRRPAVVSHLVHAAGTLTPLRLRAATGAVVDAAAREKVRTLHGALSLVRDRGLRAVVVFGSVEARRANPGFGLYAHANEQVRLAADVLRRSTPGVRFTVAEWSLWSDVGMAREHVATARDLGYADVPARWGAEATVSMLTDGATPECLALGGPYRVGEATVRALGGVAGWADATHEDDASVARLVRLCQPSLSTDTVRVPTGAGTVHAVTTGEALMLWWPDRAGWQPPRSPAPRPGQPLVHTDAVQPTRGGA